jgi:hypothetical protein
VPLRVVHQPLHRITPPSGRLLASATS